MSKHTAEGRTPEAWREMDVMYIKAHCLYKCKQCASTMEPEFVYRGDVSFMRCIMCGHESYHSTLTRTYMETADNRVYEYKNSVHEY